MGKDNYQNMLPGREIHEGQQEQSPKHHIQLIPGKPGFTWINVHSSFDETFDEVSHQCAKSEEESIEEERNFIVMQETDMFEFELPIESRLNVDRDDGK